MKRLGTFIWNLRFRIGWRVLPGDHKHVTLYILGEHCARCGRVA